MYQILTTPSFVHPTILSVGLKGPYLLARYMKPLIMSLSLSSSILKWLSPTWMYNYPFLKECTQLSHSSQIKPHYFCSVVCPWRFYRFWGSRDRSRILVRCINLCVASSGWWMSEFSRGHRSSDGCRFFCWYTWSEVAITELEKVSSLEVYSSMM